MIISKKAVTFLASYILRTKDELINGGFCGGQIDKMFSGMIVTFDLTNATISLPLASDSMNNLTTVEEVEKLIYTHNDQTRENSEVAYERQERFYTSGAAFERD